MIFPRKPEACPLLLLIFSDYIQVHSRRYNALNRIMMSKVHFVPRKQGRRPAGTDFGYFGVESLFVRKLRACMNGIILSFPKLGELI